MRESIKKGLSFGITSGIITTIGVMVGLTESTGLKIAVVGGILTVAIADAFSDAFGIHMSEESSRRKSDRSVFEATISTFFTKLIIALSFLVPVLTLTLEKALIVSIIWSLILLIIFNYILAKQQEEKPIKMITRHLFVAVVVIVISYFVGKIIEAQFG